MLIWLSIVDKHKVDPDKPGSGNAGVMVVDIPEISGDSHYDVQAWAIPNECTPNCKVVGKLVSTIPEMEAAFGEMVNLEGESV